MIESSKKNTDFSFLSDDEVDDLKILIENLTGQKSDGTYFNVIKINVEKIIREFYADSLDHLCQMASEESKILEHLYSVLTIHTTMWFREKPHFEFIEKDVLPRLSERENKSEYKIMIAACSTGEETYSYGLLFQNYTNIHNDFVYHIRSFDIDPVSVKKAENGIYDNEIIRVIPEHYKTFFSKNDNNWSIKKEVKVNCSFEVMSLLDLSGFDDNSFDMISCRNVLIYFGEDKILDIVENLTKKLKNEGLLILGHSDHLHFDYHQIGLQSVGHNIYRKTKETRPIQESIIKEVEKKVDLLPPKPLTKVARSVLKFHPEKKFHLIFIVSSTGGTQALKEMLSKLSPETPPILIVQHILPQYAENLAQSLAQSSELELGKMEDGETLKNGHIYLPRGDYHISVCEKRGLLKLKIDSDAPKRHSQRPSVDTLFESAQKLSDKIRILSFILTGMGSDGAIGMAATHQHEGHINIAQDEASCVVYGMPKAATENGVVDFYGNPKQFAKLLRLIAALE